jgi:hypothetical protein
MWDDASATFFNGESFVSHLPFLNNNYQTIAILFVCPWLGRLSLNLPWTSCDWAVAPTPFFQFPVIDNSNTVGTRTFEMETSFNLKIICYFEEPLISAKRWRACLFLPLSQFGLSRGHFLCARYLLLLLRRTERLDRRTDSQMDGQKKVVATVSYQDADA